MEQNPNFSKFRNSEHLQFFEDVGAICAKTDVAAIKLQSQVNALVQATLELSNSFKKQTGSEHTLTMSRIDTSRDIDIKLMRKVASACSYHFDEEKAKAARLILRTIDKYGKAISQLNYQAQTTVLNNLGKDLKQTKEAAAIELLGLTDVCDHMTELNSTFNTEFLTRLDERAKANDVKTAELIKVAILKWQELDTFIDANLVLNPSEALTTLVKKLDELIEAYNTTVNNRSKN